MALVNYTLATAAPATPAFAATSPAPSRVNFDDLLYQPDQVAAQPGLNEPFQPPGQERRPKVRKRAGTAYLPPHSPYQHHQTNEGSQHMLHTIPQINSLYPTNKRLDVTLENQNLQEVNPTSFLNTGQYFHDPSGDYDFQQKKILNNLNPKRPNYEQLFPYNPETTTQPPRYETHVISSNLNPQNHQHAVNQHHINQQNVQHNVNYEYKAFVSSQPTRSMPAARIDPKVNLGNNQGQINSQPVSQPQKPHGFTKVEQSSGGKTQVHAVLDYDDDYYEDTNDDDLSQPAVTPLQGPILLKNGSVPVVPLTTYPTVNNGSFYQIPILWTALSLALGYELQGQVIRGVPCVKKNYQLYCPTAGNTYPLDKIETFIDENKALIKRMYGSFSTPSGSNRFKRAPGVPDIHAGDTYFGELREKRQSSNTRLPDSQSVNSTGRVDSCESKTEIMTPYWALNSARKLRAIVNTMHFEQAIHQEVCSKKSTGRCQGDCGCEQKYKWHRLLAYDPSDDCAGIFMDWFLFPSCCVCRCNP